MTYRAEFTQTVRLAIVHLPPEVKREIKEGIRYLCRVPQGGEPLERELAGKWKLRVGGYRIIYEMEADRRVLVIPAVGHRRDLYEKFL